MNPKEKKVTAEKMRLKAAKNHEAPWKKWGSYVSERAWGTVREDYSAEGRPWRYFTHNDAIWRAYRWNEDGIAAISDEKQLLCFGLSLWNKKDSIIKERLFGLNNAEGNHGEDVKEIYYHLDNTPTHSYMKYLYKYPQTAFPYESLIQENKQRTKDDSEFEILDTPAFEENRYFDVSVEYAKNDPEDIYIRITVQNRGPDNAPLDILPSLWFRNTWSWGLDEPRPLLSIYQQEGKKAVKAEHPKLRTYFLYFEDEESEPERLFTENETNFKRINNDIESESPYSKSGINNYVVNGNGTINPQQQGTKMALRYDRLIPAGEKSIIRLRLSANEIKGQPFGDYFNGLMDQRIQEADNFYTTLAPSGITDDMRNVQRQAFSGLLWSKQFYHYNVRTWLLGDSAMPEPPEQRKQGRNRNWVYLNNKQVISMPDCWEYPWYATWDLAFHCISFAVIDPEFAKNQLLLLLRDWYLHPNGQMPSYEWSFSDTTPPVHAWAALRVFRIEKDQTGQGDYAFLKQVFNKLLINFTWWVNKKDSHEHNIFEGGFLGLDNIGVFNRSEQLPGEARLNQSDGTSWMAMYCLNMLTIALELAEQDKSYEDVATKFLEHFFYIAHAINERTDVDIANDLDIDLWDEEDNFYYDVLQRTDGEEVFLKVRSMVGLIPLFAITTIDSELLEQMPVFNKRLQWFLENRPDLTRNIATVNKTGAGERHLFSVVRRERLQHILNRALDEDEFLSPYGIRSLSKYHEENPYSVEINGNDYVINYEPAESASKMYGGNSNWRGPVWFPLNYLFIESLQKFDYYYGDEFKIEHPHGSGQKKTLWTVSSDLSSRLIDIFLRDESGHRPVYGDNDRMQNDPHFKDYLLFFEYFHGDNGKGLGAAHQTGWTALVAKLIQQSQQKSEASD